MGAGSVRPSGSHVNAIQPEHRIAGWKRSGRLAMLAGEYFLQTGAIGEHSFRPQAPVIKVPRHHYGFINWNTVYQVAQHFELPLPMVLTQIQMHADGV